MSWFVRSLATCAVCRTDWAFAVVNPQPYFDQLTATVERRGVSLQLCKPRMDQDRST